MSEYPSLLYTHQCYQSWYCWFHRVWSDAPDHHTVVFWIHITPLWNWWRSTRCFSQYTMHEVLWRHSYRIVQNMYQVLSLFRNEAFKSYSLISINTSFWCIKNDFQLKISFTVYSMPRKINNSSFKMCLSLVNKRWKVDPKYSFQKFSIMWEGYIINLSL